MSLIILSLTFVVRSDPVISANITATPKQYRDSKNFLHLVSNAVIVILLCYR